MLKAEQVRGNFEIAQFYENSKKWDGAVVYYNEVLQLDPNSRYAAPARQRIEVAQAAPASRRRLKCAAPEFSCRRRSAVLLAGCAGYHLGPVNGAIAG